jgi:hypothetical protein
MNYLGHYVYNHVICGLEPQPHFVLGVVLPDLWPRFSRRRRIRWRAVRSASVSDPRVTQLRDGMLNHVAVDQRFHTLPSFVRWQRELKRRVAGSPPRSALFDFLAHVALELMLDHRLACERPRVAEEVYDRVGLCGFEFVERQVGLLGDVDARGLAHELRGFIRRRFLVRFTRRDTLLRVVDYILSLTNLRASAPSSTVCALLDASEKLVEPEVIWSEMRSGEHHHAPGDALPDRK